MITYGSPKVGNDKFGELLRTNVPRSYRIVTPRDPIPRAFLQSGIFTKYKHVSEPIQLPDEPYSGLRNWWKRQNPMYAHRTDTYLAGIELTKQKQM